MLRLLASLAVLAATGALLGSFLASAAESQSRIVDHTSGVRVAAAAQAIDQTQVCSLLTPFGGGLYELQVRAHAGIRRNGFTWHNLAFAMVRSGPLAYGPSLLDNALGWVAAGRPSSETILENEGDAFLAQQYGTLAVNRSECRPSRARVRLTGTGLRGGQVGQLGERLDCESPRRVLVRLRATLTASRLLFRDGKYLKTKRALKSGFMAVRTLTGRPLVFAAVFDSGKARLYTARTCYPD
jgi:hypothetical protein